MQKVMDYQCIQFIYSNYKIRQMCLRMGWKWLSINFICGLRNNDFIKSLFVFTSLKQSLQICILHFTETIELSASILFLRKVTLNVEI